MSDASSLSAKPIPRSLPAGFRARLAAKKGEAVVRFLDYQMRITSGVDFYIQCKDIFIRRIYHFEAQQAAPLIIDGGSHIGTSILYFKHVYPDARIIGFEPDPELFQILQENLERNRLTGVTVHNAGLGGEEGTIRFCADHSSGGHFDSNKGKRTVQVTRLSEYLTEPVAFMKLNIEGQEWPVLREVADSGKLRQVRELVFEYHGWGKGEQPLGPILNLLDREGFSYLVHDFDAETNGASKPPFHITRQTRWFCLVYAKRNRQPKE